MKPEGTPFTLQDFLLEAPRLEMLEEGLIPRPAAAPDIFYKEEHLKVFSRFSLSWPPGAGGAHQGPVQRSSGEVGQAGSPERVLLRNPLCHVG
eukprot:14124072-Heterocapsa_arctica.AAC.1